MIFLFRYAVYVPLFLPTMMPVLFLSATKLYKYYFGSKEETNEEINAEGERNKKDD